MINKISPLKLQIIIAVASALLFIPFLGSVHLFDWDEINFAEAAREMIVTNDYLNVQINFLPFWEKPPLFIWMQVLSMKIFGINEFAARFPNAIVGIITFLVIFNIGRKLNDNLFGILWVLAFAGSLFPFLYFKSGIIDPWFNLFIFLGIYFLFLYSFPENKKKLLNIFLSATFAGLAVLTKGPVGFLLIAVTCLFFLFAIKFKLKVKITEVLVYLLVFILIGGSWFIIQLLNGNYDTVIDFMLYQVRLFQSQDAGHGGFFGYHFVILFVSVFPTSILALKSFKKENIKDSYYKLMKKLMIILFWAVLIIFTIVKTKIVHYSSLAYFPLSFLAASFIYRVYLKEIVWNKWISVLLIILSFIIAAPFVLIQFIDKFKSSIIANNWIQDEFVNANLQADVQWSGYEFLPGLLYFIIIVLILILIKKEFVIKRALLLWISTIIFTFSVSIMIVPKIEMYSQNALIEYFKSLAGKDVYIKNFHFKSYATYFYGKTTAPVNNKSYDQNWLLTGDIDKDVYFVTKLQYSSLLKDVTDLEHIGEKNGFVFFVRKAKNTQLN
ncbi:MAG: glycosyltransferase family 39 protein [Bacteroidales bacterium]|jgi:4-amino-4-deoxy-L-arabinose transferase-like glycosyltransferase|nr:glycosyltransferase family 39 protein [Bacteroidales bacterium]